MNNASRMDADSSVSGAWPRTRRWRTPEFLAPEGPARKRPKARLLWACRGPSGGAGPEEVAERVWAHAATPESAGGRNRPVGELGSWRPEHAAEAAASRRATIRRGVRADGAGRRGTPDEPPSRGCGSAGRGPRAREWLRPVGVQRGSAPGGGRPQENMGAGPRSRSWPRVGLRTEAARGRSARGQRGTPEESPRCGGVAGWGRDPTRREGRRSGRRGTPDESPAAAEVPEGAREWLRPVGVQRGSAPGGGRPQENMGAGPRSRSWPRAGLRTEAARGRSARGQRGTPEESPRCGRVAGWGPMAQL
ncbi:hypothetical protein NDU88_006679 [Pleurodeles waltl]|uniref:Uncharacterized protein n=1 Tax=Pleurodeles waltl TaxID=8319 RepID=A0AAV7WE68_PLEWA|nr:hypothetical protein NDU88_006679 [Pleurodeles waltl]